MSKILLCSDPHLHPHRKNVNRLHDCLNALEWVFLEATSRNLDDIVCAGDLFHDRHKIDIMTYHLAFNIINKYCSSKKRFWIVLGNHDLWYHDRWDISSVAPLSAIPGVTVIDKPGTHQIAGCQIDFLPYTNNPIEHLNELRQTAAKRSGRKTLVAHLAVDGAQLNTLHNTRADVVIEHDGEMVKVTTSQFDGWDQVWLGHYHGYQRLSPTVEYIGSTLQLSFGEAFQHKYVIVNDLVTGDKEYIKNTISPQHFIIPEEDIDKYDIEKNFIRLSVADMTKTDILEKRRQIQELKPGLLEVISSGKEDTEHIVNDAKTILQDEDKMLEEYVKQVGPGNFEVKHLIELGKLCLAPAS